MKNNQPKILLIDDEEDFLFFAERNLTRENYQVITANSGQRGVKLAKKNKPDLILLDIMMPQMTGFEVLEALKNNKNTSEIPVVMLTALDDSRAREKAANLKNEDFIAKPVSLEKLRARIDSILESKGK